MEPLLTLINLLTVVFGIFVCGILVLNRGKLLPFKILAVWIFIQVGWSLNNFLFALDLFKYVPHLFRVSTLLVYLIGPACYLFFRTILFHENKFRKWDWLFALPFLLHFLELIPFFISSGAQKLLLIKQIDYRTMSHIRDMQEGLIAAKWHSLFKLIHTTVYLILSINLYVKFNKKAFKSVIKNNTELLAFIKGAIYISTLCVGFSILAVCLYKTTPLLAFYSLHLSNSMFLFYLLGYLFYHPSILFGLNFNQVGFNSAIDSLEKELKLNEAKLRSSLVSETEMLIFVDKDFKIIHFNQLAEKSIRENFMRQIKVGEDYRTYLHEHREPLFFVDFKKALSGQRCGYEIELSMNGHDQAKWFQIEFIPITNNLNEVTGVNICSINIHDKKESENKNKNYVKQLQDITWRESHLLRAPISNLLGITKLLNKPESSVSEEEKKALLQIIEREVLKLDVELKDIVNSATNNI